MSPRSPCHVHAICPETIAPHGSVSFSILATNMGDCTIMPALCSSRTAYLTIVLLQCELRVPPHSFGSCTRFIGFVKPHWLIRSVTTVFISLGFTTAFKITPPHSLPTPGSTKIQFTSGVYDLFYGVNFDIVTLFNTSISRISSNVDNGAGFAIVDIHVLPG